MQLDEDALDPALRLYLQAWRDFSWDYAVDWAMIEAPVFHPKMRYAGTLDRFGKQLDSATPGDYARFSLTAIVDLAGAAPAGGEAGALPSAPTARCTIADSSRSGGAITSSTA